MLSVCVTGSDGASYGQLHLYKARVKKPWKNQNAAIVRTTVASSETQCRLARQRKPHPAAD